MKNTLKHLMLVFISLILIGTAFAEEGSPPPMEGETTPGSADTYISVINPDKPPMEGETTPGSADTYVSATNPDKPPVEGETTSGSADTYVSTFNPDKPLTESEAHALEQTKAPPIVHPSAIPTPVSPSPGIRAAMEMKMIASPPASSPSPIIVSTNGEWGTFYFITNPPGANISIDGRPLKELTPTSRDFVPGRYVINFSKEGYLNESFEAILNDGDRKRFNVTLRSSMIQDVILSGNEQKKSSESISFVSPDSPKNDNISTSDTTPNIRSFIIIVILGMGVVLIGAIYFYMFRKKPMTIEEISNVTESNDNDMKKKIEEMIDKDPNITNAEMAEILGVSVRTIQRNK